MTKRTLIYDWIMTTNIMYASHMMILFGMQVAWCVDLWIKEFFRVVMQIL